MGRGLDAVSPAEGLGFCPEQTAAMTHSGGEIGRALSIAAVERDTGIAKDTLRVWERRYGFPLPGRDGAGDRVYPLEQVEHLRRIKRLVDAGLRPARVVNLSLDSLDALAQQTFGRPATGATADCVVPAVAPYIDLLKRHQADVLHHALSLEAVRVGLASFVVDIVAPLNAAVGAAWLRGDLAIHEEHAYTEIVQRVLRAAMTSAARSQSTRARARVLLATVPQEPHALGLLMAEAILTLEGCYCIQLGAQVPLPDIVDAVQAYGADILALSFSALPSPGQVLESLSDLRAALPERLDIWVGGSSPALARAPAGVQVIKDFSQLSRNAREWKQPELGGH